MNNTNALNQTEQRKKFSVMIQTETYQNLINSTLNDAARAKRFIANITAAVAANPALQECDAGSILAAALLGESLNLAPSPQLGQVYFVPFNDKSSGKKAQFILGYKGYLQLAQRSGQLKKLNVVAIKKGELKNFDIINEEIEVEIIQDYEKREKAPTIGYYAFFELINGFKKAFYWTKDQMIAHADRYSPAFSKNGYDMKVRGRTKHKVSYEEFVNGNYDKEDEWMYSSFWYKDFDDMARKTMIRQIISKHGCPMSTEMQQAYESDNSIISIDDNSKFNITPINVDMLNETEELNSKISESIEGNIEDIEKVDLDEI